MTRPQSVVASRRAAGIVTLVLNFAGRFEHLVTQAADTVCYLRQVSASAMSTVRAYFGPATCHAAARSSAALGLVIKGHLL